ncbi:MAG: benzoyl-CoA reductase subunit B [Clostridia bacterium]|nr:MAG: benzoyl-CoA reductase subunit B [Clostridia bacterium]
MAVAKAIDPNAGKDAAMLKEKELNIAYTNMVRTSQQKGKKVCYTFVPGNLVELLHCFDVVPIFPEILGLQMGLRRNAGKYLDAGENDGYSEDICSYVKASVGMQMQGNIGPDGKPLPKPDFLFLIYSQCFTFMKWWEILRKTYDCPIITVHLPYRHHGRITPEEMKYGVDQLQQVVIPQLEEVTGIKFDIDLFREKLAYSRQMEEDFAWIFNSAKNIPSPIDGMFQSLYYVGPINTYWRGTPEGVDFYKTVRQVVEERLAAKQGPPTPFGRLDEQKYRIVMDWGITWDHFQEYAKIFFDERAVIVASTYTKVSGTYDVGNWHDPNRPFESMVRSNMTCYANLSLTDRVNLIEHYVKDFHADGFLIGSLKSCKSCAAGLLAMLRELEKRTGLPGGFFELDMMDGRYFSEANVRNRIESYFRMIDERRRMA